MKMEDRETRRSQIRFRHRVSSLFLLRFVSLRVDDDTLGDVYRDIETRRG